LAYGVTLLIPKTYESAAILKGEQNLASQMLTASVLDPVAAKLGYTPKMEADDARDQLKKEIKASYNAKDKLITLTAQATSPQAAQALANDVLAQVYVQTQPRDSAKQTLQKQLAQLQTREKELTQSAKLLVRRLEQISGNGVSEVAQGYAQLIGVIEKTQESQIRVEKELKGIDSSDLVQSPTLPTKKIAPKRSLIAIAAALAVGFALLLFVFIRQALRNASQNEESAQKINALQAAWRKALGRAA
jgi:capsular polysaccharide biosynthesis protein